MSIHIAFTSRSETEIIRSNFNCDSKGTRVAGISPAVIGKKGGKASLALQRLNGEILSIDYNWGKEAVSPDKRIAPLAKIPKKYIEEYTQKENESFRHQNKKVSE